MELEMWDLFVAWGVPRFQTEASDDTGAGQLHVLASATAGNEDRRIQRKDEAPGGDRRHDQRVGERLWVKASAVPRLSKNATAELLHRSGMQHQPLDPEIDARYRYFRASRAHSVWRTFDIPVHAPCRIVPLHAGPERRPRL